VALGVTPLRVGQEAYWLDQIARDRCEYYSGKGESPGWWAGSLAERAGLQGVTSEGAVRRLFAGQDPVTGQQRVAPVWRADQRMRGVAPAATAGAGVGAGAGDPQEGSGFLRAGDRSAPMTFRLIEQEKAHHAVSQLCRVLGVSRAGFYAWQGRPPCARVVADRQLTERIREVHQRSRATYGAPRIHAELRLDHGLHVGRKRVSGVQPHETGAASSLLNVTQQIGGSLGLSILVTVFGAASRNEATNQVGQFLANASPKLQARFQQTGQLPAAYADQVLAHGISTSFQVAVVFAILALAVALVVVRARTPHEVPVGSS
jgi:hypothetical protein